MGTTFRLPEGWTEPEVVEDVILVDGVPIHRAGMSTKAPHGEEVCGSAADVGGPALWRAWYELVERVSGVEAMQRPASSIDVKSQRGDEHGSCSSVDVFPESDAPDQWRHARSNGVAIHVEWQAACQRALWELAERDRVLRSWHGEIAPVALEPSVLCEAPVGRMNAYEWRAYAFPEPDASSFSTDISVAGVFGFPLGDDAPFALGFAGRPTMVDAAVAAAAEAIQLLAFLWGEPPPDAIAAQPTPLQHLDRYQIRGAHTLVRGWLEGGHTRYWCDRAAKPSGGVWFADLTPPWVEGLRVAKAVCPAATPLVFGASPLAVHLPQELRLHPIP